ncbi:MAG: PilZ domain-containing protein [Desulfobacteraceae bacterium]|nr:PilZ domain-containing protein [Desulfobacteraceae bacterium]
MFASKRFWQRDYFEAPIEYALHYEEKYHEATMYNFSTGGMYFESASTLPQYAPVYIKILNSEHDPDAFRVYMGQVRWCKKRQGASFYGTGVKYIAIGHIAKKQDFSCELCDRNSLRELHSTEDLLFLCLDCFKHLGWLPKGKIKESIMRFMIGNVI